MSCHAKHEPKHTGITTYKKGVTGNSIVDIGMDYLSTVAFAPHLKTNPCIM